MPGVVDDCFEVLDSAVDEYSPLSDPRNRRHERTRAGGEHDTVVRNFPALLRHHDSASPVDSGRPVAHMDLDAVVPVPVQSRHGQLARVPMAEVAGEVDSIVRRPGLLAKCHQAVVATAIELDEFLAEAMAHRAVPNDNGSHARPRHVGIPP